MAGQAGAAAAAARCAPGHAGAVVLGDDVRLDFGVVRGWDVGVRLDLAQPGLAGLVLGVLYEMAAIEDATGWEVFRRVTLPLMAPVLGLLMARDAIQGLHFTFLPALVVTDGGPPPYATTYLSLFIYRTGFEYLRYGYTVAATLVMILLTVAAVLVQWRLIRRYRAFYGVWGTARAAGASQGRGGVLSCAERPPC